MPRDESTASPSVASSGINKKVSSEERNSRTSATSQNQPYYITQGHNGANLVAAAMDALGGWKRLTDRTADNWKLKWTECKSSVNYSNFREGEQLVNHLPNCDLLTNKLGLLLSLREHERVTLAVKNRPPKLQMSDFFPETYIIDDKRERDLFIETFKHGELWINKPTGLNQGIGITMIRDIEVFKKEQEAKESKSALNKRGKRSMGHIAQRYILNPLLLEGKKFDIRCYMLVGSTTPFVVLYHDGYIRLCIKKYNTQATDLTIHLTNQYIQKKDPGYEEVKNDTIWSMETFNKYLNENHSAPELDWSKKGLVAQIHKIILHMFNCVRHKLSARVGYFELFGLDFMIDSNWKVWLIEVNTNPAMHVNCDVLKELLPKIIQDTCYIALECFEKNRKNQPISPLKSISDWSLLYNGTPTLTRGNARGSPPANYRYNVPSRYRSSSISPIRDMPLLSTADPTKQKSSNSSGGTSNATVTSSTYTISLTSGLNRRGNSEQTKRIPIQTATQQPFENSLRKYQPVNLDASRRASVPAVPVLPEIDSVPSVQPSTSEATESVLNSLECVLPPRQSALAAAAAVTSISSSNVSRPLQKTIQLSTVRVIATQDYEAPSNLSAKQNPRSQKQRHSRHVDRSS